jgi:hypothetical protein
MRVLSMIGCKQLSYQRRRLSPLRPGLVYIGIGLLLCNLLILLSACSSTTQDTGPSSLDTTGSMLTPTQTSAVASTPTSVPPVITQQVVGCPSSTISWDRVVGTHANVNKVQKVICGSLEGAGTQTLVDVRYYSPDAKLDVYVYDNITGTPTRRFSLQGLLNGDALISSVGTLITAEVSPKDIIKGGPDLFKEYKWNGTTFGQVYFPGIYPDMTRYQAEQDQARLSAEIAALPQGQPTSQIRDAWKLSFAAVSGHLAQQIFHWQHYTVTPPPNAKKLSIFTVTVTNLGPGGGGFMATVHHLNEISTNIFEIWQVSSSGGSSSISTPTAYAQLSSPISVSGTSMASGSILGQIVVYDDVFTNVGTSDPIRSSVSSGLVQFTNAVKYQLNASGLEEGAITFYATNQNNVAISNQAVMVKVLLSA